MSSSLFAASTRRLNEAAAREGDEWKGAQAGAALRQLPLPSNRERKCVGAGQSGDVGDDQERFQGALPLQNLPGSVRTLE